MTYSSETLYAPVYIEIIMYIDKVRIDIIVQLEKYTDAFLPLNCTLVGFIHYIVMLNAQYITPL